MSIYATNFIVDENTGEEKLVKHLNKKRIDRGGWNQYSHAKGWNKSGKKARMKKTSFPFGCLKTKGKRYKEGGRGCSGNVDLTIRFDMKKELDAY